MPVKADLSSSRRWLLMACGPMNVVGAFCFSPLSSVRAMLHLPEPDPFYLWVLSSWILAFGAAYFYQGWTGRPNRTVLLLGVWGKLVFALQLASLSYERRASGLAAIAALPDGAYALMFGWWLIRR
jgi:hypothetical protein